MDNISSSPPKKKKMHMIIDIEEEKTYKKLYKKMKNTNLSIVRLRII